MRVEVVVVVIVFFVCGNILLDLDSSASIVATIGNYSVVAACQYTLETVMATEKCLQLSHCASAGGVRDGRGSFCCCRGCHISAIGLALCFCRVAFVFVVRVLVCFFEQDFDVGVG